MVSASINLAMKVDDEKKKQFCEWQKSEKTLIGLIENGQLHVIISNFDIFNENSNRFSDGNYTHFRTNTHSYI